MLGILPEHTMFTRTPQTFYNGQKIYFLDCRYEDYRQLALAEYFVVGTYLYEDLLGVQAVNDSDWAISLASQYLGSPFIDSEVSRWEHGETGSGVRYFSILNPFFLTEEDVAILAGFRNKNDGVTQLLKFLSFGDGNTDIYKEKFFRTANWVLYWGSLHPRSQT